MAESVTTYRGVRVFRAGDGFFWEEPLYGNESDDLFPTLGAAKADIERQYGAGPAPRVVNGEVVA